MSSGDYYYWVCKTSASAEITGKSFIIKNKSTDGLLCIVDRCDQEDITWSDPPTKPSYVLEAMPNWPRLSKSEAKLLDSYQATSDGASDGYYYSNKGIVE